MSKDMLGIAEVKGVIADLLEKLGGPNGEEWLSASKRFLRKEELWPKRIWSAWKEIMIGGVPKEELLARLERNGFVVSAWAKDMMRQAAFTTAKRPRKVQLVRIKVSDLGFTEAPTTTDLFNRAKERGLALCSAEVGPHLRLALSDQPIGDCLWVAMELITDSVGDPSVFKLGSDSDGRWLSGYWAGPGNRRHLEYDLVFQLRK